ncbi:MAG: trypsin-like serine protease [Clostridia bacterium]|nr:trypsin-like serine protease [Clostridia bacterium]
MKKLFCFVLCLCMIGGMALSASAATDLFTVENPALISTEVPQESVEIATVDLTTGETTYSTITYTPELTLFSDGTVGKFHQGWFPEVSGDSLQDGGATTYSVIGSDERTKVTNTKNWPYSAICCFGTEYTNKDGELKESGGTAWMIGSNLAVTAAHCIYDRASGNDKSIIGFWPGKKGEGNGFFNSHNPFGNIAVTKIKYPVNYQTNSDVKYDWAVLVLAENIGDETGWFSYSFRQSYPTNQTYTITGYPFDDAVDKYYMYTASGIVCTGDADEHATTYYHEIDTESGQSGAPMYDSDYVVYGIHRGNSNPDDPDNPNYAVRITLEIHTCLERINEIEEITGSVYS